MKKGTGSHYIEIRLYGMTSNCKISPASVFWILQIYPKTWIPKYNTSENVISFVSPQASIVSTTEELLLTTGAHSGGKHNTAYLQQ